MHYLANHTALRSDPRRLDSDTASAQTVMVCAFSYYHPERQQGNARFAMYAHGDDYHEVLRKRLQPIAQLLADEGFTARICIDSAPVAERYWATQSGVGFTGRNSLLIVPGMGSYFFLAEIITSAPIEPDSPCRLTCGDCGRCVRACPGGALVTPGAFNSRRCLSYLTIEHRGSLPFSIEINGHNRTIAATLGNRVYGCDTCQEVCPHNANPPVTQIDEFRIRPQLRGMSREEILAMTPEQFADTFRHSAVKRAKLAGLQRNARACGDTDQ